MDKEDLFKCVLATIKDKRIITTVEITALAILGIPVVQIFKESANFDAFIQNVESAWSKSNSNQK